MSYSRSAPSPRYVELISLYQTMHVEGEKSMNLAPEKTFAGQSLGRMADLIKQLVDRLEPATLLDYGAGKGQAYAQPMTGPDGREYANVTEYWGVESVTCYDPAYVPFSELPSGRFDGVICTDVLEHCPEEDLHWILEELFAYSRKFVFGNIATYPAKKHLPNGENAHCTVRPSGWWSDLVGGVAKSFPSVRYMFIIDPGGNGANGQPPAKAEVISG